MTLTLRGRIILTVVPLVVLQTILGVAGVVLLSHLGGRIDSILRENYDSIIAVERLNEALERIDSSFQFTLAGQEAKARAQYQQNWTIYREKLRLEQENITLPGEKELVGQLTGWTDRYQQQGDAFYARPAHDPERLQSYFGPSGLLETFTEIKSCAVRISRLNQDNMEQASRAAKRTATVSVTGLVLGLAAAAILAAIFSRQTLGSVLKPIKAVTQSALGIGKGDLDQVVPYLSRDALGELAEAFNDMTRRLRADRELTEERTQGLVHTTETLRRELSDREQMERSLRQMAAIVESSDDAIIGMSMDGVITSWNKGAERVFGHSAERTIGQSQAILVPPGHMNELPAIEESIKRGEHIVHFETIRRRKDGRQISVSLTDSPLRDDTGAIVGVACIARDITERKQAEEAVRRPAPTIAA